MVKRTEVSPAKTFGPRIVLVGGLPRSGTTALVDLLNEREDVAIMAEYRLADLTREIEGILEYGRNVEEMGAALSSGEIERAQTAARSKGTSTASLSYQPFSTPGLKRKLRYPRSDKFAEILASVVRASLEKPNAQLVGSKTPGTMLSDAHGSLRELASKIKYVALLRSPIEQVNSTLNRRNRHNAGLDVWHIRSVGDAIAEYESIVRGLIVLSESVGENLMFIKYDDLISEPKETYRRLCEHLEIEWQPSAPMFFAQRGTVDVLTEDERNELEARWQPIVNRWDKIHLTGTPREAELSIFDDFFCPLPATAVSIGGPIRPAFLSDGWSQSEDVGVWSEQEKAILVFGPATKDRYMLKTSIVPYLASGKPLTVRCSVNGEIVGSVTLCPGEGVVGSDGSMLAVPNWQHAMTLWFGPMLLETSKPNFIDFQFRGNVSPSDLGDPIDKRLLGISLRSIEFLEHPPLPKQLK